RAAIAGFVELVALDHGAHGAVQDQHAGGEGVVQRLGAVIAGGHEKPIVFRPAPILAARGCAAPRGSHYISGGGVPWKPKDAEAVMNWARLQVGPTHGTPPR